MSYLDKIQYCNRKNISNFVPFFSGKTLIGHFKSSFLQELNRFPDVFLITRHSVDLRSSFDDVKSRTLIIDEVIATLAAEGVIDQPQGEKYPVKCQRTRQLIMFIDRAAALYFGVPIIGQHVNGYFRRGGDVFLWIARRSSDRRNYPERLDNLVGGGLPYGSSPEDNLVKECEEEASIPVSIVENAKKAGFVSYSFETPNGLDSGLLYCYDLELPESFIPINKDAEVEEFFSLPVDRVAAIVRDTTDFKPSCNLVIIDFLIRYEFLSLQVDLYRDLAIGLRSPTGFYR